MSEDEQVDSSTTEETVEAEAKTAAEPNKTEDGPKPNYVPQSRLNEMAKQKRDAEARAEQLQERLERLEAESANRQPVDMDPATKDAKDLITETTMPLIERSLSDLRKEAAKLNKELATLRKETSQSTQEIQWQKMCSKVGADPDNKELIAVTAGLAHNNLTTEDALKRAMQLLGGSASKQTGGRGASVENKGFDGVPQTSDWVPKTNAEAAKGAAAGKHAKQLSSAEIYALKQKRA